MKIIDLITLDAFMEAAILALPGVNKYLPLSNGEKAVDEISAYYTNDYAGTTAFFQVAEISRKDDLMTFQASLTVAQQPADSTAKAGLLARNATLHILMALLGHLDVAADEAQRMVENTGDSYDLIIAPVDRIYPIGLLANVALDGHYVDLDITVPANPLLFPNG